MLREAWDWRGSGQTLTRNSPLSATEAHLALIGDITAAESRLSLTTTSIADGFLNRFLFVACRRTQLLPEGAGNGTRWQDAVEGCALALALEHARDAW